MQKISKCVQNYSKYHSKVFTGKYYKIAGNFWHCRQSIFAGKLPAKPMSTYSFRLLLFIVDWWKRITWDFERKCEMLCFITVFDEHFWTNTLLPNQIKVEHSLNISNLEYHSKNSMVELYPISSNKDQIQEQVRHIEFKVCDETWCLNFSVCFWQQLRLHGQTIF